MSDLNIEEAAAYFREVGETSDLREPHRIPGRFMAGLFEKEAPDISPSPIVAFINSRSGGRAGPELSTALKRAIGTTQVFELGTHRPDKVLRQLWENFDTLYESNPQEAEHLRSSLRIITAGGDGTVAWVLQTIARMGLNPPPAVAVIPLGTGNDLSRSFGWGAAFSKKWISNHKALYNTFKRVTDAEPAPLDRWRIRMTAPSADYFKDKRPYGFVAENNDDSQGPTSYVAESWNYISVGMDAKAAQGFHHLRDTKPKLAFSRAANQFWYGWFSCSSGWFCCSQPLNKRLELEVCQEDGTWKEIDIPASVRAVVLLNLQSYGGGRNIWGKHDSKAKKAGFCEPSNADGMLEVVAFKSGYHAGAVMASDGSMSALRLAQATAIRMNVRGTNTNPETKMGDAFFQLDGEPWKQTVPGVDAPAGESLLVEVTYQGHSNMLLAPGAKRSVPSSTRAPPVAPEPPQSPVAVPPPLSDAPVAPVPLPGDATPPTLQIPQPAPAEPEAPEALEAMLGVQEEPVQEITSAPIEHPEQPEPQLVAPLIGPASQEVSSFRITDEPESPPRPAPAPDAPSAEETGQTRLA